MSAPTQQSAIFENKMSAEEMFAQCDFTKITEIVKLFPSYKQEQYTLRVQNKKNVSKAVNIEAYTMQTPFKDQTLLKATPLTLESGRRTCLYGANSTGKTLLFHYMATGQIEGFPKHISVHHCKELEQHEVDDTVLGAVVNSHPYRNILLKVKGKLLELKAASEGDTKLAYIDNLEYVDQELTSLQSDTAEDRAQKMLRVLGFDDVGMKRPVAALSGGLRMRVALCMAFFMEADLLLLDEPTNHLDFPSVLWLENRLRGYKQAFLMVSHDRELLNNVCQSVILIEDKQLKYYQMGFREFEKKKTADDEKNAVDIDKWLQRNRNPDPSTMEGKLRQEKLQWVEKHEQRKIALAGKFTFPAPVALSTTEKGEDGKPLAQDKISLINLQNVRFSYNPQATPIHWIFDDPPISFNVTASTRVGVMGPNGAGKSTFLKLLTHKLTPTEGKVEDHPKFTLAYFGQHSTAELDLEQTPSEWMKKQFPKYQEDALRKHLNKTGVVGDFADTRIGRLSFSQRSCIIFAKLTFICPHLLILDEPTNFLDLESVDSLIAACNKYKGALLLVSHNRDFLKKCANQYLSIVPGHFLLYDNMKDAERGTYTFIAEMEEGIKVGGAAALAANPGGGAVHSSAKKASTDEKKASTDVKSATAGIKQVSLSSSPAPNSNVITPTFAVGEKVKAKWTDGKFYNAIIKKVEGAKYHVTYIEYGNTVAISAAGIQKLAAAAAPAAATKGATPASAKGSK